MGLSMAERSAVTKQMARRYERATKTKKGLTDLYVTRTDGTEDPPEKYGMLVGEGSVEFDVKGEPETQLPPLELLADHSKSRRGGGPSRGRKRPAFIQTPHRCRLDPGTRHLLRRPASGRQDRLRDLATRGDETERACPTVISA